jgi:hypothetical protein
MSPFEKQGQYATSSEPLNEYCLVNGIDLSIHFAASRIHSAKTTAWNNALLTAHSGNVELAEVAFEIFKDIDKQGDF